ncbi:MAG: hypothetical protein KAH18_09745 [Psychromonas sp.]|nr:hypothetical protein [Psychromonas sp.]
MVGVLFGYFGVINDPDKQFTEDEKSSLRLSVAYVDYILYKVNQACIRNFEGDLDKIKLWFGDASPEVIVELKKNTHKLLSIFTDTERYIKFINAREQHLMKGVARRLPENNRPDQLYDNAIAQGGERSMGPENLNAFVFPLSWSDPSDQCSGHVGSVMNIYIGNYYFNTSRSFLMKAHTIIHELSHKILFTVDYAYREYPDNNKFLKAGYFSDVYGENKCKLLAIENPKEAMRNADCMAYFFCCFVNL